MTDNEQAEDRVFLGDNNHAFSLQDIFDFHLLAQYIDITTDGATISMDENHIQLGNNSGTGAGIEVGNSLTGGKTGAIYLKNPSNKKIYADVDTLEGYTDLLMIDETGRVWKADPSVIRGNAGDVPEYSNNADAITNGLISGDLYRTGDDLKIVH